MLQQYGSQKNLSLSSKIVETVDRKKPLNTFSRNQCRSIDTHVKWSRARLVSYSFMSHQWRHKMVSQLCTKFGTHYFKERLCVVFKTAQMVDLRLYYVFIHTFKILLQARQTCPLCDYFQPYVTNIESDNWRLPECDSFPDLLLLLFLKELDLTVLAKIENILETSGVRSLI